MEIPNKLTYGILLAILSYFAHPTARLLFLMSLGFILVGEWFESRFLRDILSLWVMSGLILHSVYVSTLSTDALVVATLAWISAFVAYWKGHVTE